jgi:electron transfer DM13
MQRRTIGITIGVIALGAGFWAFRPDRLFVNAAVNESFPAAAAAGSAAPKALFEGRFHGVAHATDGTATIHALPGGKRVLRFTDFRTSNGPEVHVYLVAARDASDSATVKKAGFIDLGSIKGNVGNQNYDLPPGVDLSKYRAVTIWCRRFGVNFATAPLQSQST